MNPINTEISSHFVTVKAETTFKEQLAEFFASHHPELLANESFKKTAITICSMLDVNTIDQAEKVILTLQKLHRNEYGIIEKELNLTPEADQGMIELQNIAQFLKNNSENLETGLIMTARLYQEARATIKNKMKQQVFGVNIDAVIHTDPRYFSESLLKLDKNGNYGTISLTPPTMIDSSILNQLHSLANLEGDNFVVIGGGGGSDSVQACMTAMLLQAAGKKISCVMSVRTAKFSGETSSGNHAGEQQRSIENHGGEIFPGVFIVKPDSYPSNPEERFLENFPAEKFPTYLVMDEKKGELAEKFKAAIAHATNGEKKDITVLDIDTGGDITYRESVENGAKSTPDQDKRVLDAVIQTGYNAKVGVLAIGVDSPTYVNEVLAQAQAKSYTIRHDEADLMVNQYNEWKMDGSHPTRFGKTPLALMKALSDQFGIQTINLPKKEVVDKPQNPWIPFIYIQQAMKKIMFMDAEKLNQAISLK